MGGRAGPSRLRNSSHSGQSRDVACAIDVTKTCQFALRPNKPAITTIGALGTKKSRQRSRVHLAPAGQITGKGPIKNICLFGEQEFVRGDNFEIHHESILTADYADDTDMEEGSRWACPVFS